MKLWRNGISAKTVNLVMAVVIAVIAVLLIQISYAVTKSYTEMSTTTEHYVQWQQDASDLQVGSDYLTEQVRCFAETGDRVYLDNYFEEANVTKHRDKAVQRIYEIMGDTPAYQALVSAMAESVALMDLEYYSMRLKIEACGYDLTEFPEVLQKVELKPEDAALSPVEKDALARSMVFDDVYRENKVWITSDVQKCLSALAQNIEDQRTAAAEQFNNLVLRQRVLVIITIVLIIIMLMVTLVLIVNPLMKSVSYIREEKPIPVSGSSEFMFLAETYNRIFEMNREQKEQLAFEATHDNLTGVYNRNGYDMIQRNTDWNTSALVLFDLDKFKSINDDYGHKVGDLVLERAAKVISNSFRAQDFVCRIGGDEFAVIMIRTDPSSAEVIKNKVASINKNLSVEENGVPPIQMSCGVAYGEKISNFDLLFKEADKALYKIKNNGGGGCMVCL